MILLRIHAPPPATISVPQARRAKRIATGRRLKSDGTINCGCWYFLVRMLIWAARNGAER